MGKGSLSERMEIEFLEARRSGSWPGCRWRATPSRTGCCTAAPVVVLAETLGSVGAMLHAGEGGIAVGLDINATHHRAARQGWVTAEATALSPGATLASYDVAITDEEGTPGVHLADHLPDPGDAARRLTAQARTGTPRPGGTTPRAASAADEVRACRGRDRARSDRRRESTWSRPARGSSPARRRRRALVGVTRRTT